MAIKWDEKYSVNVKEIDDQHKNFIEIMNKLYAAVNEMRTKEDLKNILNELTEYADKHFTTEEKYFDEFHYELADEHKQKHKELKEKIIEFQKKFGEKNEISLELSDFLENWLVDHLDNQDKKYTECFNKNGLY